MCHTLHCVKVSPFGGVLVTPPRPVDGSRARFPSSVPIPYATVGGIIVRVRRKGNLGWGLPREWRISRPRSHGPLTCDGRPKARSSGARDGPLDTARAQLKEGHGFALDRLHEQVRSRERRIGAELKFFRFACIAKRRPVSHMRESKGRHRLRSSK